MTSWAGWCDILEQMRVLEESWRKTFNRKAQPLVWQMTVNTFFNVFLKNKQIIDWAPFKRMDELVWLPLLDQLEQEHAEDGFDKPFFLKLMTGDGASKPENWERLVRDWKVCIDHQVLNKLKDFISLRQNNFETGLVRMMDQITRNMKTKGVSEQRAVQAWELMTNGWTETEFERRLNQVKIQDKYPEIKEIVAKMGRVADANGKDRLTIASGG